MFDITRPGAVNPEMHVAGKKPLFHDLAAMAAKAHGLDAGDLVERLTERERLGTTGFGGGTAIPHARIPELDHVVGAFVRLTHPVDYGSVDGVPVDLVYLLLSPVDAGADAFEGAGACQSPVAGQIVRREAAQCRLGRCDRRFAGRPRIWRDAA